VAIKDLLPREVRRSVENGFSMTITRLAAPQFGRGCSKSPDQFADLPHHKSSTSADLFVILSRDKIKSKIDANVPISVVR
jgi:hypothetical protein